MARKAKAAKAVSGKTRGRKPFPRDAHGNIIRPDGAAPKGRKTAKTRADAPGVATARARTKVTEETTAHAPAPAGDNQPALSAARQKELHDQHLESAIKVDRRVKDAGAAQRALAKQVKADLGPFAWQFLQAEVRAAKDPEEWQTFADKINRHIELARITGRKLPGLEFSQAAPRTKPSVPKAPPATAKNINEAYRDGEAAGIADAARVLPERFEAGSVHADAWFQGYSSGVGKRMVLPATNGVAGAVESAPRPPHQVHNAESGEESQYAQGGEPYDQSQGGGGEGDQGSANPFEEDLETAA